MRGRIHGLVSGLLAAGTLGAGLGAAACHSRAVPEQAGTPAADTSDLASLRSDVRSLIGDAACTHISQCRLIAFGAKPCGGPRQFLVYSIAATDSMTIEAAVMRYNARDAEVNRLYNRTSDCALVSQPRIRVVNGRCTI